MHLRQESARNRMLLGYARVSRVRDRVKNVGVVMHAGGGMDQKNDLKINK